MREKNPITSSELGTLWLTYQEKTLILRVLEYFIEKADDREAINIMGGLWQELHHYVIKMRDIFAEEGVAVPRGFTKEDVNIEAPVLYDNAFDIMITRILKEISLGMYTINMNMTYREDIFHIYKDLTSISQRIYNLCTRYLLKKGVLTLLPNVTMPKTTEFIQDKKYLSGLNPFIQDRPLNDIEVGVLHHGIEANNVGLQLITGFAQVAEDKEVKDYFVKGMKLAKKQIKEYEEILLESDIQFSATSGSTVTDSTTAPFSMKLMMFCIFLLNNFGLVGSSFGTMFTLRNDVSLKQALIAKEIYSYAIDGIKIMINHQWLEEPPQTLNRSKLIYKDR